MAPVNRLRCNTDRRQRRTSSSSTSRTLQYEGRIDSNSREELATKHEARDALDALLSDHPIVVKSTPAVGCSTKWAYKEAGAKAEIGASEKEPVKVEMVSVDQLKTLRTNNALAIHANHLL